MSLWNEQCPESDEGLAKSSTNASVTRIQNNAYHPTQNGYIVSLKVLLSMRQDAESESDAKTQALDTVCGLLREMPDLHVEVLCCRRDSGYPKISIGLESEA